MTITQEIAKVDATEKPPLSSAAGQIFTDKRVFQIDYVPDRIIHREKQIAKIQSILADLGRGVRPRNILCIGDFGTGKTAVVRFICRNLPPGTAASYVNCSDDNTSNRIIKAILRSLGIAIKSGFPKDHYLEILKDTLKTRSYLILMLDELDKFVEREDSEADALFYTISRTLDNVAVIMLTNRMSLGATLTTTLDSRVRDTFRFERIEFEDYDASQLGEILADRCRTGLKDGTYDAGIAAMIARAAFEWGLRARGVIDLARKAGEIAEAKQHDAITEDDVRQAIRDNAQDREMDIIRHLPPVQHAILGFVLIHSPASGVLLQWWVDYATTHGQGPSPVRLYGYLKELETIGLVVKEKRGLGRGRGITMIVTVPPELVSIVTSSLKPPEPTPTPATKDVTINPQLSQDNPPTPSHNARTIPVTNSVIGVGGVPPRNERESAR